MGPMGPMMGGGPWGGSAGGWPWLVLLTVVVLVIGLLVLVSLRGRAASERRPSSPEEVLRDRYARGDLTRRAYREALVDVLKDRYVRGELDLEEYETRLGRLFGDERPPGSQRAGSGPVPGDAAFWPERRSERSTVNPKEVRDDALYADAPAARRP